jgi:hypothetical protein
MKQEESLEGTIIKDGVRVAIGRLTEPKLQ